MRIGILQCDDVIEALQFTHGNYPAMFTRLFKGSDIQFEFRVYRVIDDHYPDAVDDCDAYITTGSRYGVNDDAEWVIQFAHFVAKLYSSKKKLIGICFGHQMMVKALGGKVVKSPKGWGIGVAASRIIARKPWMDDPIAAISLIVSHQDQVVELPEHTEVIAGSDFCPFYMIQISDHFLGIQGHPEFSKAYSQDLMDARRDRIPPQRIATGEASLALSVDDILIAHWLENFLHQEA